jgi:hypothetical protein
MRLLTQPIFRYSSTADQIADGAIFVFVQGTDPEVFLQVEARDMNSGPTWHYALSRMDSTAFQVRYKDEEISTADVVPWDIVFNKKSLTTC